ncbi:MAG: hypothetical protein ACKODH_04480 [Limisphaerales bacterium]
MLLLLLAALLELVAWLGCQALTARGIFYRPRPDADFAGYHNRRHPVLGWPAGDRFIPRRAPESERRADQPALVSLYGESFTFGAEVNDDVAWGNILAARLDARVDNFGVGGYGTDQALLRHQLNTNDHARVVVLGIVTENLMRNVNQYRDLLYASGGLGFKPRFMLNATNGLELVPLFTPGAADFPAFTREPGRHLAHEFFTPDGGRGVGTANFPFILSLTCGVRHFSAGPRWRGEPWHADFYRADHPSRALALTVALAREFQRQCRERGQSALILLLPTGRDLQCFRRHSRWVHTPLVEALRQEEHVLDMAVAFAREVPPERYETLYITPARHLNAAGNALLANLVAERIRQLTGFRPEP